MVVAALLSLTVQSFVVQTHLHLGARSTRGQTQQSTGLIAPLHHRTDRSEPLDCPGCRQLARAASVMLPPAIILAMPIAAIAWFARFWLVSPCAAQRSHRWRNRGPPPEPVA